MPIAIFSNKIFQVDSSKVYTFEEFQYSAGLQTEKQDSEGAKPSTYNKGPALDSMSFKIKLNSSFGVNPRVEWEEWQAVMNAGIAYAFILGTKPLSPNKWLLSSVSPSNFIIDNYGNILSMELSLQFDEYVRPGSAKESIKINGANSSPGIVDNLLTNIDPDGLGTDDKSSQKRQNSNMTNYSTR